MCKRSDNDPLIRALTERYRLNILRLPRADIKVGELLIEEGKDLRCCGRVSTFFTPELDVRENEPAPLPDLGGVMSERVSAKAAAEPLTWLLAGLGAVGITSISAMLGKSRDVSVAFGVSGAQYRSTDLVTLGDELSGRVTRENNALYRPGRKYFVAHAIAEASTIRVAFDAECGQAARLALDIEELIKSEASVHVDRDNRGYLVFSRPAPVTFGLAVAQLDLTGDSLRLDGVDRLRAVRGKGSQPAGEAGEFPGVLFGGPDGDFFVEVDS